jgi:hypothetical protein
MSCTTSRAQGGRANISGCRQLLDVRYVNNITSTIALCAVHNTVAGARCCAGRTLLLCGCCCNAMALLNQLLHAHSRNFSLTVSSFEHALVLQLL